VRAGAYGRAVEPVCGVRRLRLAYGARCDQRHRPRAVEGRAAPRLAVTLLDGRRVVGRYHDDAGERSAYVYPLDTNGPILGSGV
jgi:hypothetical protein